MKKYIILLASILAFVGGCADEHDTRNSGDSQSPASEAGLSLADGEESVKPLQIKRISQLKWIYEDRGTGAALYLSVWRADLSQHPGYYSLGDVAMPNWSAPKSTIIVRGDGNALAEPADYKEIWNDKGSGGKYDVSLWEPIPRPGYRCLGHVAHNLYTKPPTNLIRCVDQKYVVKGKSSFVWNDRKSGAKLYGEVYQSNAANDSGLGLSTFISRPQWGNDGGDLYYVLNKSYVLDPSALSFPTINAEVAQLFAPRIYFHQNERFFPSSIEFFLPHVTSQSGFLTSNQPLDCPSCTNLPFLTGQDPTTTSVPVYAQIVERTKNGSLNGITDIIYWTFYPYNRGKRVCLGLYSPLGCIGGYSTFGHHVGDWENVTVRFVNGVPSKIALSAHGSNTIRDFGSNDVEFVDITHPVVYAADGSHGLYFSEGRNRYQDLPNGDFLADDMGRGKAWDTWQNVVAFQYQVPGTYTGSLSWLNFTERWGNPKAGCDIVESVVGECILNPGPTGPMSKSFAHPASEGLE